MKRSEMVNKTLKKLDVDSFEDRVNVSNILRAFEELGMLPPSVGVGERDEYGYLNYETEWEEE